MHYCHPFWRNTEHTTSHHIISNFRLHLSIMGVCQSTLCPLAENSVMLGAPNCNRRPKALQTKLADTNKAPFSSSDEKVLSPTMTEATTPGSDASFTPSAGGPLSLTAVISSGSTAYVGGGASTTTTAGSRSERKRQPSRFHFNEIDSVIEEETEPDAPSDEEEYNEQQKAPALAVDPASIIMNPPLLAPSPKEVNLLLKCRSKKNASSSNDRMLREFQKLKLRAQMVARQEKTTKRRAKMDARLEEVKLSESLWNDFEQVREKAVAMESKDDSFVEEEEPNLVNRRHRLKKNKSFDLQDTNSWYVNFRTKTKQMPRSYQDESNEDEMSCQSGLSLLSKESMEAQRLLYAEKRHQREARFAVRRKKWEAEMDEKHIGRLNENATRSAHKKGHKHSSRGNKDYETYFQEILKESEHLGTPMTSPPKLAVRTAESKVTLDVNDYGPVMTHTRTTLTRDPSITDMEVEIPSAEKQPPMDDTSAITDVDFDTDFRSYRRRRGPVTHKNDEFSIGSSLISYGGLSSCTKTLDDDNKENVPPGNYFQKQGYGRRRVGKNRSYGVGEMTALTSSKTEPDDLCFRERPAYSLGDRIADLERKMGIGPPEVNAISENNDTLKLFCCDKTNTNEAFRVVGLAPRENCTSFVDSPAQTTTDEKSISFHQEWPALEPTQLQRVFDQSGTPPSSSDNQSYSDVRERIVMGNCNHLRESIAFMTTEDFRRISTDHALVRWDKGSLVYRPNEYDNEEEQRDLAHRREESFADDIADEVENLLARYRQREGDKVIDAHEMLRRDGHCDHYGATDESFTMAQGKLYSA